MASLNKVQLIGNLGNDPEIRYLPNGDAVANLSLATNERWKDKETGEQREHVEWHRCVFFQRLAEVCGEFLKKGSPVYVEGKLKTRKWQDKDGIDRYTTEIHCFSLQMLGTRDGNERGDGGAGEQRQTNRPSPNTQGANQGGQGGRPAQAGTKSPAMTGFDDMDDDIPF